MKKHVLAVLLLTAWSCVLAQRRDSIFSCRVGADVSVTIDLPASMNPHTPAILVFFALPNGNSTAQTMGKKMNAGDDWHYDIQHIRAQTRFIRSRRPFQNLIVAYLENDYKSWPLWKSKQPAYQQLVQHIADTVRTLVPTAQKVYFNGHSGGGRFIFSFLDGVDSIPSYVERISFLDSNYGYDSTYTGKLINWLERNPKASLNVFAYNDSVALYQGKPVVSATGGTWYRSHLMLRDLSAAFTFQEMRHDSVIVYKSSDGRIQFWLKANPDRKIFHTQQVELNGFIHSILCNTRFDERRYRYYTKRAYSHLIE